MHKYLLPTLASFCATSACDTTKSVAHDTTDSAADSETDVGGDRDTGACVPSELQAPVDLTHLPFGDDNILRADQGDREPAVGSLWLCGLPPEGRGNSNADDWSNSDGTWDFTRKPTVDGAESWESLFTATVDGTGKRIVTGNGLPSTLTGVFPTDPDSVAYQYDPNGSHIAEQLVNLTFDAIPQVQDGPTCLPFGATGISLTGSAIYHASSTLGADAAAYEMLDDCGGQSDGTFTYHTHFLTDCLLDALDTCTEGHSALMGYAMDGFGLYGPRGDDGTVLGSADLDECHGHTEVVDWDGELVSMYHYHWTYDFPYNIGCFRGTPVEAWNGATEP